MPPEESIILSLSSGKKTPRTSNRASILFSPFLFISKHIKRYRRNKRRVTRYGLIAGNVAVIFLAMFIIIRNSGGNAANYSALKSAEEAQLSNPLDVLSATDIAVNVALMTRLPETGLIINEADTVNAGLQSTVGTREAVLKPQILSSDIKTKADILDYTIVEGDTLSSLAEKFGVTSDSIRWSNNLSSTRLRPGTTLAIPPVNGIVYTVKANDTPESLANKYGVSQQAIIRFNDAEISGLVVDERIVIPGGVIRAAPVVSRPYYAGFAFGNTAIYGYNGYVPGYCTWYVANKRAAIGRPLPANLGNAGPWISRGTAARAGFAVNRTPAAGAAVVTNTSNPGHVAFVEEVRSDGSVLISEMNRRRRFEVTTRIFSAGEAARYWYIH